MSISLALTSRSSFVQHHRRYDDRFERHRAAYLSELLAVRALPPAGEMLAYARSRAFASRARLRKRCPSRRPASTMP